MIEQKIDLPIVRYGCMIRTQSYPTAAARTRHRQRCLGLNSRRRTLGDLRGSEPRIEDMASRLSKVWNEDLVRYSLVFLLSLLF